MQSETGEKDWEKENVTYSTLSQKIFRNLKTCIDGAPGEMALSNFSNHEKNKEKWKNKEILLFLGGKQIYQTLHVQFKRILTYV